MSPAVKLWIGLAATCASAAFFHGPGGYGERALATLEAQVGPIVAQQEVRSITAAFARDPLSRDLVFTGRGNAFQRKRYVELIQEANIRGIRSISWNPATPVSREPAQ